MSPSNPKVAELFVPEDPGLPPATTPRPAVTPAAPARGFVARGETPSVPSAPSVVASEREGFERARAVLARHREELLRLPGVLDARTGYKASRGWLSRTPAIVVTVLRKQERAPAALPTDLEGVPVDVAAATPRQQLLALAPEARRRFDLDEAADIEELVRVSRYVKPPDLALRPVTGPMRVTCCVSPDAGFAPLGDFLGATGQRLTVAMYDFTAPHIVDALVALGGQKRGVAGPLRLLLDPKISLGSPGEGENPKADDKPEDDVLTALEQALGDRLQFLWAAVKLAGKTTGGIFGSAYHEKVAVRDGRAMWLSSGNWQSSNQPGPDAPKDLSELLRTYNREWHVIVESAPLSRVYEEYIDWDMSQARPLQAEPRRGEVPELIAPGAEERGLEVAVKPFEPLKLEFGSDAPLTVQPILSPDNYAEQALAFVQEAKESLYVINQYIKVAKENADGFEALLRAVRDKVRDGLDVRIIVRDLPDTRTQLEELQRFGFDLSCVKVLAGCHTKGMVADSARVIVGSHNWSNDGVLYNRDASLRFDEPRIAQYFEKVFLFDWDHRARQKFRFDEAGAMPVIATGDEAAPRGATRIGWRDLYED